MASEVVTPAAKRKAVAHLMDAHGMSERRACKAIGYCRMTIRYQTTRADDAGLRQRMRAIAEVRRRFGYRRLHVLLKQEGYLINHKNCSGSTGKKGSRFAAVAAASGRSGPGRRWWCR